jgi:NADH-quinone oxidoreductase subunit L
VHSKLTAITAWKSNVKRILFMASTGMLASFVGPLIALNGADMMNPHGALIATCATSLSLPVLRFSRRYLHGEHLFTRFSLLSSGLLLGFNAVAMAPSLEQTVVGWGLFGFASTFLIGLYNDCPNVRNNAIFAFAAYRISDYALLTAVASGCAYGNEAGHTNPELLVACLLLAAMFKSSQIPLTALFARSMEGPTPSSALGYAGLSVHVGVVLLASRADIWMSFDWARTSLGVIGACTAVYAGLVSQIHADRKGALAYATSSTLGLI